MLTGYNGRLDGIALSKTVFLFPKNTVPSVLLFILFLTPAHKGWGYSPPLHCPGGGHKNCGCSTA